MNVPEVTRERIFTRDKNGDFSRRVIDTLFRLATLHWSRIFAFMRGATYLQPTVKAPSSYMYYQWFGNSVPGGRGRSSCSTWSRCESVYGHITIFCVSLGCLLPSVCPLAVCYPLCAPWLSVTLTVVANLKLALYSVVALLITFQASFSMRIPAVRTCTIHITSLVPRLLWGKGLPQQEPRNKANVSQTSSRRLCRGSHELRARMPARGLL